MLYRGYVYVARISPLIKLFFTPYQPMNASPYIIQNRAQVQMGLPCAEYGFSGPQRA